MRLKILAGGVVLAAVIVALFDRVIHGTPELAVVWLLAIIGITISGITLLVVAAGGQDRRIATAIARRD